MQNLTFVPQYRNSKRPYGTFLGGTMRTFNAWINKSDSSRDVAFVTTKPLNGQKLVDRVGGFGITWGLKPTVGVTVFGYPGDRDNGEVQNTCSGTTQNAAPQGLPGQIDLVCSLHKGASGGPWLTSFTGSSGIIDGVSSTGDCLKNPCDDAHPENYAGRLHSPYFDSAVGDLFTLQGSLTR